MYEVFHKVLRDWITNDDVINIDFYTNMTDIKMRKIADDFGSGSSNGIFSGCIGAIDGWLVKRKCPSMTMDRIINAVFSIESSIMQYMFKPLSIKKESIVSLNTMQRW